MQNNSYRVICLIALAAAASISATTHAATLLKADLVLDGSVMPPGDRLDVSVYLTAAEPTLTLIVRPFLATGKRAERAAPIHARGERNRAADGTLVVTKELKRPTPAAAVDTEVVIPYQDFDLAEGLHQVAYEVQLVREGKVLVTQATALSRVKVTREARREMQQAQAAPPAEEKVQLPAVIGGPPLKGNDPQIENRTIEITVPKAPAAATTKAVPVNIDGGFHRERIRRPRTRDLDDSPLAGEIESLGDRPWHPASEVAGAQDRIVYYATNRVSRTTATGGVAYATDVADQLSYGSCRVNFPVLRHRKGQVEEPSWWQERDPKKHFLVESINPLDREAFLQTIGPRDLLLFVHGYNNNFDSAVLRTAQIHYDLEFPGAAMAFSWPSLGSFNEYETDTKQAAQSITALADLLRTLVAQSAASPAPQPQIHIIAHSLGNRVLLGALFELQQDENFPTDPKPFGQIVLAAPDIGAARFNNLVPYVTGAARQVTYYYCTTDTALATSQRINHYEPVGMFPLFEPELRTINADRVDTSFLGHGYFSSSPLVLLDIQLMVNEGLEPDQRMPPIAVKNRLFNHPHWSFTPSVAREIEKKRDGVPEKVVKPTKK